jgi:hypothetical protein
VPTDAIDRQGEMKTAALTWDRFHPNLAVVGTHDATAEGKANAVALLLLIAL